MDVPFSGSGSTAKLHHWTQHMHQTLLPILVEYCSVYNLGESLFAICYTANAVLADVSVHNLHQSNQRTIRRACVIPIMESATTFGEQCAQLVQLLSSWFSIHIRRWGSAS